MWCNTTRKNKPGEITLCARARASIGRVQFLWTTMVQSYGWFESFLVAYSCLRKGKQRTCHVLDNTTSFVRCTVKNREA